MSPKVKALLILAISEQQGLPYEMFGDYRWPDQAIPAWFFVTDGYHATRFINEDELGRHLIRSLRIRINDAAT